MFHWCRLFKKPTSAISSLNYVSEYLLSRCVLGNTTILAEFAGEEELNRFFAQGQSLTPTTSWQANPGTNQTRLGGGGTVATHSISHWNSSSLGGGGGAGGTGSGGKACNEMLWGGVPQYSSLWGPPSAEDGRVVGSPTTINTLLPGDLLSGESMWERQALEPPNRSEIWNLTSKNQANHLAIINVSGTVKNQETGGWGHTCKEAADLLPPLFLFCFVLRLFIGVILIIRLGLQYSIDFVRRTVTKREVNLYRDFSLITDTVWKCILLQTDETSCHFFLFLWHEHILSTQSQHIDLSPKKRASFQTDFSYSVF